VRESFSLERVLAEKKSSLAEPEEFLGCSQPIRQLLENMTIAARGSDRPVLISGPMGSGKSHLARLIHKASPRAQGPLIFVNCGGLPETLENTLFGHQPGAFTGAVRAMKGHLQQADGGILVLDDVERLSPKHQDLFHRALVDGAFYSIGGEREQRVNVRFVATTNKDLEKEVESGRMHRDFLSRLDYFHLVVPPLRERRDDLPELCQYLLQRSIRELAQLGIERPSMRFDEDCWPALAARSFEDNIRGLEKMIVRLVARLRDREVITPQDLDQEKPAFKRATRSWLEEPRTLQMVREIAEKSYILDVCQQTRHNYRQAARILGISPKALYSRLHSYGISRP